tara:strand:+ start:2102 stop:2746 length:645 start_codon:yes stop_codon:yes gene_type:complete
MSRVILSADITNSNKIFNILDKIGNNIGGLKLHCDIILDWDDNVINKLIEYKEKYKLLIIEDRKWCDIGNTTTLQLQNKFYKYDKWVDIFTVHSISGEGPLKAIYKYNKKIKVLLIAEMSTLDNLINKEYTQNTKNIAHNNKNVIGYICQNKIDTDYYLHFTPGVSINNTNDDNKQSYNHPEKLKKKGIDYFIIGRSLYNSNNIEEEIKKYLIY